MRVEGGSTPLVIARSSVAGGIYASHVGRGFRRTSREDRASGRESRVADIDDTHITLSALQTRLELFDKAMRLGR